MLCFREIDEEMLLRKKSAFILSIKKLIMGFIVYKHIHLPTDIKERKEDVYYRNKRDSTLDKY